MKTDNYITLLSKILTARKAVNQHLLFDRTNKREVYLTLLNIRIVNLVESILCLYNANLFSTIAILFRSVIEANLDFENLIVDDNYINDLDYRYLHEWERLFDSSQKGNPFLNGLVSNKDTLEMVDFITKEYSLLKNNGYKALTIKERFDKLNQSSVYLSIYNSSCCESHNNLRALINWNTLINKDKSFSINSYSENKNGLMPFLDSTTAIFINSTIIMMNYFKVEVSGEISLLSQELDIIRNSA